MLRFSTNIGGQFFRFVLLAISGGMLYGIAGKVLPQTPKQGERWFLYFLITIVLGMLCSAIASYLGIIQVRWDAAAGTVTFQRWWGHARVPLNELVSYYSVAYPTRRVGSFPRGWMLKTREGRQFELTPTNVNNLPALEPLLQGLGLLCRESKPSSYPFTPGL